MFERVAVVGATGAVGRLIRRLLEEREFPFERLRFLASARSAGTPLDFRGEPVTVEELRPEVFEDIDLAIASTPDDVAAEFVPWAVERQTEKARSRSNAPSGVLPSSRGARRSAAVLSETATATSPWNTRGMGRSRSQVAAATGNDASWNAVDPKR